MVSQDTTPTEPTAAYPAHWEADVVLRDGSTMHVRPVQPSDAEGLQTMHRGQSESSVIFRFFAPRGDLSDKELHRYTHVDHRERVALVMIDSAGVLQGIGRFDATDPGEAEVAFYVSDSLHGTGLGSVLLEHLAAAAREVGVETFTAEMLPNNGKMLGVFRDAGFPVKAHTEDGVLFVRLSLEDNAKAYTVRSERERRAESLSMDRLLGAGSVLLGACGTLRPADALALERVRAGLGGFTGTVLDGPVEDFDPAADPDAVTAELAVLAGPPADVVAAVDRVARLGARGVVVVSGGFAETAAAPADGQAGQAHVSVDEGVLRQRELLAATRRHGLRLVGPRSYGLLARGEHGELAVLTEPLPGGREHADRAQDGQDTAARTLPGGGGVGLFGQSTESSHMILSRSRERGIPVASLLSAGNRADVSGNDAMQWWTVHEHTRVGVTYLESIGNPRKYGRIARRLARQKPVVGYLAATAGSAAPPGHRVRTSTWPARVLHELLRQSGVQRVGSVTELMDLTSVLATQPELTGRRIGVLASSPAYAGMVSELLRGAGFTVPRATHVDLADGPAALDTALRTLTEGVELHAVVVALSESVGDVTAEHASVVARHAAADPLPWIVVDGTRTGCHRDLRHGEAQVPALGTARSVVRVLGHLRERAEWLEHAGEDLVHPEGIDTRAARTLLAGRAGRSPRPLPEQEVRTLLGHYGITLLPSWTVRSAGEAVSAARLAREVSGDGPETPLVLKLEDPVLSSRSSLGGLRLGLRGDEAVRSAAEDLLALAAARGRTHRLVVQPQAAGGVACSLRGGEDALYGPVVSFGLAGDATDLLDDVSHRVAPLTDGDVRSMITTLRAYPRLQGQGGLEPADLDALADLIARTSELVDDLPEVREIVLEPVIVGPEGVVVAGARVTLAQAERQDTARRTLPSGRD